MKKILFLIRSLGVGGAERQIAVLAIALSKIDYKVEVAVFYEGGEFESLLRSEGIPVYGLQKKSRWDLLGFFFRLRRFVKETRPNVVYSFLNFSNILGALIKFSLKEKIFLIMGVRTSHNPLQHASWIERLIYRLEAFCSKIADQVICNSFAGRDTCKKDGFSAHKITVIHNGLDPKVFKPEPQKNQLWREKWGVKPTEFLVGLVARIDPLKDHETFLKAASYLILKRPNTKFACIGGGVEKDLLRLQARCAAYNIEDHVIWPGSLRDMAPIYNSLDIVCLSSISEGFPNVLIEAMACGVPVVSTCVGDAPVIINNPLFIVPPKDPKKLADALDECLSRRWNKDEMHQRIALQYSIEKIAMETKKVIESRCVEL